MKPCFEVFLSENSDHTPISSVEFRNLKNCAKEYDVKVTWEVLWSDDTCGTHADFSIYGAPANAMKHMRCQGYTSDVYVKFHRTRTKDLGTARKALQAIGESIAGTSKEGVTQ